MHPSDGPPISYGSPIDAPRTVVYLMSGTIPTTAGGLGGLTLVSAILTQRVC